MEGPISRPRRPESAAAEPEPLIRARPRASSLGCRSPEERHPRLPVPANEARAAGARPGPPKEAVVKASPSPLVWMATALRDIKTFPDEVYLLHAFE